MGWSECFGKIKRKCGDVQDRGTLAPAIVFIAIYSLAGVALLAISIWMYVDTSSYLAGNHNDKFFISIYILMGVGSLMTLVGFLGCCGAMQESSCMLATFSTFVLLIFAAEVAGAVYASSHQDEVKRAISDRLKDMVKQEYNQKSSDAININTAVDAMQRNLKCCGAEGPEDWSDSVFNQGYKEPGFFEKLANKLVYKVPVSCCREESLCTGGATAIDFLAPNVYSTGCVEQLQAKIEQHLNVIVAVAIGIAVIQVFGFVFSLVLCCAVSGDRY